MARARSTRRLLLVLTAGLVLAAALAFVLARDRGAEPPREADATPAPTPPLAQETPSPAAPAQPTPQAAEPAAIPHTRLPLLLLATVVDNDPTLSIATILDTDRSEPAVMSEGHAFEGRANVHLAAIERERVLIDNDGVREQLVFFFSEASPIALAEPELSPDERERRRALAQSLRELTEAGAARPAQRGGLLAEGDVSAVYEDGELVGVHLDGIRAGGLYDRLGLHDGDVVTKINGVSLSDPDAMAKLAAQMATSGVLELSVDRAGAPPVTVELPTGELDPLSGSEPE